MFGKVVTMVKYRGIKIAIVSQFDILKLPEFRPLPISSDPFQDTSALPYLLNTEHSIVSCYVPIYPGSQIWFEYSIDGPHPPNAAYFFKMLHNGQVVTSWDCTARHGYHGKTTYNLQSVGGDPETGMPLLKRQAFKFSTREHQTIGVMSDSLEIRVHRIEHRQRIPIEAANIVHVRDNPNGAGFCFVNSGVLEPTELQRRYKYQLLDPADEPYSTFRFYYRSYEFLELHNIVRMESQPSISTSEASTRTPSKHTSSIDETSNSEKSLRVVTKDSVEELPSSVPRSPTSNATGSPARTKARKRPDDVPASPSKPQGSPMKLLKKALTLNLGGAEFDLDQKTQRRPISPFNSGGLLRRKMSPIPSAPATITEFGPTVHDEIEEQLTSAATSSLRGGEAPENTGILKTSTRTERGGRTLMGFLGRRTQKIGELAE